MMFSNHQTNASRHKPPVGALCCIDCEKHWTTIQSSVEHLSLYAERYSESKLAP